MQPAVGSFFVRHALGDHAAARMLAGGQLAKYLSTDSRSTSDRPSTRTILILPWPARLYWRVLDSPKIAAHLRVGAYLGWVATLLLLGTVCTLTTPSVRSELTVTVWNLATDAGGGDFRNLTLLGGFCYPSPGPWKGHPHLPTKDGGWVIPARGQSGIFGQRDVTGGGQVPRP